MTSPTNSDFFAALDNYVDEFGKIDLTNANSLRSVMAYLYDRFPNSMDLPANQSRLFWSGNWNVNMNKHNLGETLTREQFPEAACVFNESFFEKVAK